MINTVGLVAGEDVTVDVAEFRHYLAGCRTHDHAETDVCPACVQPLTSTVALYRGEFLAGFTLRDSPSFDEWQLVQSERLLSELAGALEQRTRALARLPETLEGGLFLVGCVYNFCTYYYHSHSHQYVAGWGQPQVFEEAGGVNHTGHRPFHIN